MLPRMTSAQRRELKAAAQRLEPIVHVGKQGLTPALIHGVHQALDGRELIKIKFRDFKDERETLAAAVASQTGSEVVQIIGHVAVLYRPKPEAKE
jgi:RNA-binding protein